MCMNSRNVTRNDRRASLFFIGVLMLGILCVARGSPAWATPSQSPLRQSIPTRVPTPIPSWVWITAAGSNPADYAPSGLPDLDQQQEDWRAAHEPGKCTHCGAVALADVVWWLDSSLESSTTPPPTMTNTSFLLSPYGNWDDHDPRNVVPLVNDLAARLDTNGGQSGQARLGTDIGAVVPALQDYLMQQGLRSMYDVRLVRSPGFEQLANWVLGGQSVILYLGLWQYQGAQWIYFGGHYAAVAGVEPANRLLAICDPARDAYEAHLTQQGRRGAAHEYPHTSSVHNDVRYLSHDAYAVSTPLRAGGGEAELNYAIVVSRHQVYLPVVVKQAR